MDPLVVVGGGIAGVTCAKTLSLDNPHLKVVLVSASPIVKMVSNLKTIGRSIDIFDVIEQNSSDLQSENLSIFNHKVIALDSSKCTIELENKTVLKYSQLCICTGAKPKIIPTDDDDSKQFIRCIRDTQTAKDFQSILTNSKRILVVGNGGIAIELVYEVIDCEIVWAIRDKNFGATFFDAGTTKFFSDFLNNDSLTKENISKRHHFMTNWSGLKSTEFGVALGPDWHSGLNMKGQSKKKVLIENNCEVFKVYKNLDSIHVTKHCNIQHVANEKWNIYVELTNGKIYGCDVLISATGVVPNVDVFISNNEFKLGHDGGLTVDNTMKTSIRNIYAAGDCCSVGWKTADHWFQMRLWSQARQMGYYASKCISAKIQNISSALFFNFEVFAHVTKFFGFRVILLGLYNAQKLASNDYKILYRVVQRKEFIKVILQNGKMKGAILVGETDFEETFENLIYNQIDLSRFGDHLLDNVLDVEDFFD